MLKLELHRAFMNKRFIFSLLFGCLITLSHVVLKVLPASPLNPEVVSTVQRGLMPTSVFNGWIGYDATSLQAGLYFILLPLLATFPYGDSYFTDITEGYINNLLIRHDKMKYLLIKFFVLFLSGAVTIILPLVISLLCTMSLLPSIVPEQSTLTFGIWESDLWADIFINHPYVYTLRFLILIFIFSGLMAVLALTVSFYTDNKYIDDMC